MKTGSGSSLRNLEMLDSPAIWPAVLIRSHILTLRESVLSVLANSSGSRGRPEVAGQVPLRPGGCVAYLRCPDLAQGLAWGPYQAQTNMSQPQFQTDMSMADLGLHPDLLVRCIVFHKYF